MTGHFRQLAEENVGTGVAVAPLVRVDSAVSVSTRGAGAVMGTVGGNVGRYSVGSTFGSSVAGMTRVGAAEGVAGAQAVANIRTDNSTE